MILFLFLSITSIDSIIHQPELRPAQVGVCIFDLETDRFMYAYNSQKLFIPASNMKIVTTGASLYFLGPDYRFKTRLAIRENIKDNTINGDVVIIGGGDPTFSLENLEQFISTIKKHNVREITGDIVLVDDYFTDVALVENSFIYERLPRGWAWHYLDARYAPEISALSMNKNTVNVKMEATRIGDFARVSLEPETEYVTLTSTMRTKMGDDSIIIYREPDANVIYVGGGIGIGHEKNIEVAVKDPTMFVGQYFKERLNDTDIKFQGELLKKNDIFSSIHDTMSSALLPTGYTSKESMVERVIDSVLSDSLINILRETDVESVNLYAEILLKTLGARYYNEGSFYAGLLMVKRFLRMCGADTSDVSLWDGSGMSTRNLISPYDLILVLRYMYHSALFQDFYELLPTPGEGTLEYRFENFSGTLRAKTGTLHAISCLTGYVSVHGHEYCFSMMFNNFTCPRKKIEEIQEDIVKKLVAYLAEHK